MSRRFHQAVLIGSTVLASWLGMQAVHECGHVLGALATGGEIKQVVLHPLTVSRTDLALNPQPLLVVWAGPVFGILFPLASWSTLSALRMPGSFVVRFFAGFYLIANGAYLAIGSFDQIGDCGEMLRHGSRMWHLWLFGAITIPVGFWMWHRQVTNFGLGSANSKVNARVAYATLTVSLLLVVVGFAVGGE